MAKFKVLLLYPDYLNDSGTETYMAVVDAENENQAIEAALDELKYWLRVAGSEVVEVAM